VTTVEQRRTVIDVPPPDAEDLIREARRRHRRRQLSIAALSVLVLGLGIGFGFFGPGSGGRRSGGEGASRSNAGAFEASEMMFSPSFVPIEIVADGGHIWALGSGSTNSNSCTIRELNSRSLTVSERPVPSCGMNITAGDGALFLEVPEADVKTQSYNIHIERISTTSSSSQVFTAISGTTYLGSDIAHTQLTYVDGALWLYGTSPGVSRISPSTGRIETTLTSPPPAIGGTEPIVSAVPGGVWLAGGAGSGTPEFLSLDSLEQNPKVIRPPGRYISIYALATFENHMYFGYISRPSGPSGIAELTMRGRLVRSAADPTLGSSFLVVNGSLYSADYSGVCNTPVSLWRIDPTTLRSTRVAEVLPSGGLCGSGDPYRLVASAGGEIFVLQGTEPSATLIRFAPRRK
jgi:hypothetical protein